LQMSVTWLRVCTGCVRSSVMLHVQLQQAPAPHSSP
jgi:hypothetical protein